MDEDRELDAVHEHNRRSWDALLRDEVLAEMTADELRAMVDILKPAPERKQRNAERN